MQKLLNYYLTIKELLVVFLILFVGILIVWSCLFPRNANADDFNWHYQNYQSMVDEYGEIYCMNKTTDKRVDLKNCSEIF